MARVGIRHVQEKVNHVFLTIYGRFRLTSCRNLLILILYNAIGRNTKADRLMPVLNEVSRCY